MAPACCCESNLTTLFNRMEWRENLFTPLSLPKAIFYHIVFDSMRDYLKAVTASGDFQVWICQHQCNPIHGRMGAISPEKFHRDQEVYFLVLTWLSCQARNDLLHWHGSFQIGASDKALFMIAVAKQFEYSSTLTRS